MEKVLKVAIMLSAVDKMTRVVDQAANSSIKSLTRVSKEADKLSKSAFEFGRSAGAFGLAMAAPLGLAVNAAAEYESMNVALKTAFQGNQKAADDAMKTINTFAAKTPYELEEVMGSFIKLKNLGMDPSMEALEAYGNTASSMGKSLNDMIEAVADASTGEFERLKEFGIRANSQGDKVSFTFQGVTTTVGKNSKEIEAYLKNIGKTKFAGGMEAQSKTLKGQLSTLKDNVKQFGVAVGNVLVPVLKDVFAKITPVLEKVQKWTRENPKLTRMIVLGAAAIAALSLVASGMAFVFGGVMKVISFGTMVFKGLTVAIQFSGKAFQTLTRIMMMNPIILIIMGIAMAVYLVIKYWRKIVDFFKWLWESVKGIFKRFWEWLKGILMKYTPFGLIFKYWEPVKNFFKNLWANVKQSFWNFVQWVVGLPKRFFQAGVKIVTSIWDGIKSKFQQMVDWFKGGIKKLRDMLPFSPAKTGPLRDIHRLKLVETIASNIKPGPMVKAMDKATGAVRSAITKPSGLGGVGGGMALAGSGGGGRGSVTVNFNPTINVSGGASASSRQDFLKTLREYQPELMRMIEEGLRRKERTSF